MAVINSSKRFRVIALLTAVISTSGNGSQCRCRRSTGAYLLLYRIARNSLSSDSDVWNECLPFCIAYLNVFSTSCCMSSLSTNCSDRAVGDRSVYACHLLLTVSGDLQLSGISAFNLCHTGFSDFNFFVPVIAGAEPTLSTLCC